MHLQEVFENILSLEYLGSQQECVCDSLIFWSGVKC